MKNREFNLDLPIAYLITWTTYGTWLPGDQRGWKKRDSAEIQLPNLAFERAAKNKMKECLFLLAVSDREIVEMTIRQHCEFRGWELHAANPRSNHVHVVVSAAGCDPDSVAKQLKSWCTRKLKPKYPSRKRFWTERSSRRWINQQNELEAAVEYVLEAQDRKGAE